MKQQVSDDIQNQVNAATYRQPVKVPPLPENSQALNKLPAFPMKKAEIIANKLVFQHQDDIKEVLQNGFFLIKIPENIHLTSGDKFVNNFYLEKNGSSKEDIYRGYKHVSLTENYQGYFDRPYDQWENFYIESKNWEEILPQNVQILGHQMASIGIIVLKNIFEYLGLPATDWNKASGGLTANKGHKMLAFNHFRSEKPVRGTKLHRDSGWVTVLRSTQPGLVALINDKLYAINPCEGYFIINFGSSLEVLTEKMQTPVRANIHGVVRMIKATEELPDRTSYVVFLDSDLSENIYVYDSQKLITVQSMKDFAAQEVNRTYDNDTYL